jgi:hypothetical protein
VSTSNPNGRALAATVLVAHQRMSAGSCLCGWSELGRMHSEHVAEALERAGLLVDYVRTYDDFPIDLLGD